MSSWLDKKSILFHKWKIVLVVHKKGNSSKRILEIFYVAITLYIQAKLQTVVSTRHSSRQHLAPILPWIKGVTLAKRGTSKTAEVFSPT